VFEHAGVEQLVFEFVARSLPVDLDQVFIWVGALRILVEVLHVGVRRRAIEIKVVFLNVFAVVGFVVGQTEKPLFKDGIIAVPQRQREAQHAVTVRNSRQPVLAPAVGARARLVVGEIIPGVAVRAVVLAHGSPLPLAQVRTQLFPRNPRLPAFLQSRPLCVCRGNAFFHCCHLQLCTR
jgi:hypothetical protein